MQLARKISVFIFALIIFIGSVGINVFAHFCKVDGVNYSYVVPLNHTCSKEKAPEKSCCHSPKKVETHEKEIKKNCCSEEVRSFRISSDLIQKSSPEFYTYQLPAIIPVKTIFAEIELAAAPRISFFEKRPPPKTGQEILIFHQVFRI